MYFSCVHLLYAIKSNSKLHYSDDILTRSIFSLTWDCHRNGQSKGMFLCTKRCVTVMLGDFLYHFNIKEK